MSLRFSIYNYVLQTKFTMHFWLVKDEESITKMIWLPTETMMPIAFLISLVNLVGYKSKFEISTIYNGLRLMSVCQHGWASIRVEDCQIFY